MHLKTKLAIDRLVGTFLIWIALAAHRRTHGAQPDYIKPDQFVILKFLGLGSIVQASPLIAALKNRYPDARVIFLTKRGNDELARRIPLVDTTMTVDDASIRALVGSLWRTMREVRALKNTCFINLEAYSKLGVLVAVLSGASWKAGFFRNPADLKLARVFDFLVYFNPGAPISQVYLQLGRAVGASEFSPSLARLAVSSADEAEAEALLDSPHTRGALIILINPNASELRLERRWPASRFAQLISKLLQLVPNCQVLLIGTAAEAAYTETVQKGILPQHLGRVRNVAGALSLGGLIALIGRARLMITNDSGPMHIAFSLGTPTVSMFGPVEPNHYSFEGTDSRHAILYHRIYCSPCVHHFDTAPCRGDNVCMKMITHTDVLNAALGILRSEPIPQEKSVSIVYTRSGRPFGVLSRGA